jgi:peptidyl-prolyl cis-trans isomerase A (cyclophilin A)
VFARSELQRIYERALMRVARSIVTTAAAAAIAVVMFQTGAAQGPVRVLVQTELGDIVLEVDTQHAPRTAANFLRYLDAGQYDGGAFHRTVKMDNQPDSPVKIEVIQAGVSPNRTKEGFPPIAIERTSETGLRHTDGAISMARSQPDSATSGWFICINDQPSLDFGGARNPDGQGFAAFGRVVQGMDVVRKIQRAPNSDAQRLTPPITILKAARVP